MTNFREQVEDSIQATIIHSPTTYSWFGKFSGRLPLSIKRALTSKTARDYLLFNLQSQLYNNFYCQGFVAPMQYEETVGLFARAMPPFVQELAKANSGSGYWADGWEVRTIEDGKVVVCRGGLELWTRPEDCRVLPDNTIGPNQRASLRFPKEFLSISPGFYMALGDDELAQDESRLVRFYWNIRPEGAIHFMRNATLMLNQAGIPFKLKALNDPIRYTRCDAVVLYVRKRDYGSVSAILKKIYPEVATHLKQGTPAFTKLLAAGVGFAEDPGQGDSFGLNRCRLLAEGLIRAYEQGYKMLNARLQVVEDCFTEAGISLETPYLNHGSRDDYEPEFALVQQTHITQQTTTKPNPEFNPEIFLQTAYEIGQRLAQEAVWFQDRCNWLGAIPAESFVMSNQTGQSFSTLGSDLYAGTSGVALFLAELYKAMPDEAFHRTALGAVRHALARVDTVPSSGRLGLYSGWVGIALAAARIGALLCEEELLQLSTQLLQRAKHENRDKYEFDIISGNAGAIAALVILRDILSDAFPLDFAVRLADELLHTADKSDLGYSWKSVAFPTRHNLTGFSHGTAGVGYALLELFHATGDSKYKTAAEQAFNYERQWFDANEGNWPDFREKPAQSKQSKHSLIFATFWCHGAPGIAVSRLRAYEILQDETCRAEAIAALQTTRRVIENWLYSGNANYSLCHGMTGNAEVLIYGNQVLGPKWADDFALAIEVANRGIQTYAANGHQWPCGTGGGQTPNLMLGLAGIGYFYLRFQDPTIPSVLITKGK